MMQLYASHDVIDHQSPTFNCHS